MPRILIDGTPIGCPAIHGEGNCPMCGGGWPGTTAPSESLVRAARAGRLRPELLGCGPLISQAQHLIRVIAENDSGVGPVVLPGEPSVR